MVWKAEIWHDRSRLCPLTTIKISLSSVGRKSVKNFFELDLSLFSNFTCHEVILTFSFLGKKSAIVTMEKKYKNAKTE